MFAYVARQPIFDVNRNVYAYELLFRIGEDNCFPDIPPDEATSKILTSTHLSLGIEEITGDKKAFINFHRDTLMYRFPTSLDASKVVIEIVETVEVDDALIAACKHIRGLGYPIALDDYDMEDKWDAFVPFTSIVKIDITEIAHETIPSLVKRFKSHNIELVAEKIETYEEFHKFKEMGFDYFQGYFLAKPEIVRHRKLGPSALTMMELLTLSSQPKLNFDEVNRIIERDPSLTYLLLRFINNPLINKRNKITSLKHALNFMGEVEVKKFIALLALANLNDGQPQELMQMALVRAKFCELVFISFKESENQLTGFLTGLLSMLDAMMEQHIDELVSKVPISDNVKDALCGEPGVLKDCLTLAKYFERANWAGIKKFSGKYNIQQTLLHGYYNEAMKWAHHVHVSAQVEKK
ncbi:EAL domain-containing protein [Alteromonas sp. K632G]|jgi:c-di-GMP-related signal transduction protein|uniref:EAL and HDOD domain-containing protein n=1 Tax=Alteromonas sp. K632G TaxID=2820757 RepID=UPI000C3CD30F|nr:EAL domain-containing protein [Alteromonas sp. K632G]MBB67802.1 diguanylate phosphodiesterase [Rickettsiales bacterium]MBO7924027.1 EAL domain-containing protein [Alteromonas sp. K632G]|tara:strand:- start:4141 stop:5370 length:1230 start_codon:yes stop_codon:yes gene_type:complete